MNWRHFGYLIYGTMLFYFITFSPKFSVTISMDTDRPISLNTLFNFSLENVFLAFGFSLMAFLPTFQKLFKSKARQKAWFKALVMPWIIVCVLMFVKNVSLLWKCIYVTENIPVRNSLLRALFFYIAMMGFAVELICHWHAVYRFQNIVELIH